MATKLFLRNTTANRMGRTNTFDLLTTAGSSLTTAVVNTQASGSDIQWTSTAGGTNIEWMSPPFDADFTLATTDTITFNIWALESSMNANAGGRVHVLRWRRGTTTVEVEFGNSPWDDGVEFGTSAAVMNWTGTVSSNISFKEGDRLIVRYYINNVGTMGGGFTCRLDYNGGTGGADGDSWVQLNNTVAFKGEVPAGMFAKRHQLPPTGSIYPVGHPLSPLFAWLGADCNSRPSGLCPSRTSGNVGRGVIRGSEDNISTIDTIRVVSNGLYCRAPKDQILLGPNGAYVRKDIAPTACTVILGLRRTHSTALETDGLWWGESSGATFIIYYNSSGVNMKVGATTLTYASPANGGQNDTIWAFTAGSRGMEIWENGIKVASNATTSYSTNLGFTVAPIILGWPAGSGVTDAVIFGLFYYYATQLSPAALRQIYENPF